MLLKKLQSTVENSKVAVAASRPAEPPKPKVLRCDKCGGNHFWQSRKTEEWECFQCAPPRKASQIAAEVGNTPAKEALPLDGPSRVPGISWGPFIVTYSRPVCECGCNRIEEVGNLCEVLKKCCLCRRMVLIGDFDS